MSLASRPAVFELPDLNDCGTLPILATEWQVAAQAVAVREAALAERRRDIEAGVSLAHINRWTIDLIRGEPVPEGQRNNTVYSASRNLAEAGASMHLVRELLREPSLDTGLPPREVDKTLERGFNDGTRKPKACDTGTATGQQVSEETECCDRLSSTGSRGRPAVVDSPEGARPRGSTSSRGWASSKR